MNSHDIRKRFLEFFAERGHEVVASASLIPTEDPTLLFTNAGMNQFKAVLLGQERRSYVRAASSQKCMRVSGKHNDLEAVGRDGRHHTFFEMLGNWSFGDYYKREAIEWAWEFLTKEIQLPADRLLTSVYKDDDDSFDLWTKVVGVPADRVYRLGDIDKGDDENFWSMGDTGPCGPSTEIHFDQGVAMACGPKCGLGVCDCDRWLELWNLVFIQYDRDAAGKMTPLAMQSVDTGMGLERVAALKVGASTNYGSDLFVPIIDWVAQRSGHLASTDPEDRVSMQVIADHARALAFTVADGGRPGNDGRGYVLRRVLRRAARHGRRLGFTEPFLHDVADQVIALMGGHYRELVDARDHVRRVIRREEERFNETLDRGLARFAEVVSAVKFEGALQVPGVEAFTLHDTFGFPLDLTEVMAEEHGLTVDTAGFETAMDEQRARARAGGKFQVKDSREAWRWVGGGEPGADRPASRFVGYEALEAKAHLVGVRRLDDVGTYEVMLDVTPFYAESGGQVGDVGVLEGPGLRLRVLDTVVGSGGPVHRVRVEDGDLEGQSDKALADLEVTAKVESGVRLATMRNHTATHLLHAALREHLGDSAQQAGSLVAPDRLRFDFHFDEAVGRERLDAIEAEVNRHILEDRSVAKHVDVPLEKARSMGAIAMFGEKYGDKVRVIQVDDVSVEFCGGTHLDHTGEIGMLRITGESAVGAGLRRVEAVTGAKALEHASRDRDVVRSLAERFSSRPEELLDRVEALHQQIRKLQGDLNEARKIQAGGQVDDLLKSATDVDGVHVIAHQMQAASRDALVQMGDTLRERLESGVAVLGTELDGKAAFLVVVTDDLIRNRKLKAGDIVKDVAALAGGSGGGRPHLAQAGGKDPGKIPEAVAAAADIVRKRLG